MAVNQSLTTGAELRDLRLAYELTQGDIASAMGSTQQYVSTIEGKATVKPKAADRYRQAVYAYTSKGEGAA